MKHYFVELFFPLSQDSALPYSRIPEFDKYSKNVLNLQISASDWDSAERLILQQHPATTYIHLLESRGIDH